MASVYVCALPDLFDFLSDGFGQRESLCLNPLDGHRPAITAEEKDVNPGRFLTVPPQLSPDLSVNLHQPGVKH